jgi:hypothetical protein
MTATQTKQPNDYLLIAAYAIGAIVALMIPARMILSDPPTFFVNFLWLYLPTAVITFATHLICQRSSAVFGVSLILSVFLALYALFAFSKPGDGLVWLGYWFSLPGTGCGAVLGAICIRKNWVTHKIYAPLLIASATLVGLTLNYYYLCLNFVSCRL